MLTPEVFAEVLHPATHTPVAPQCQLADGTFVQDSSEMIDAIEAFCVERFGDPKAAAAAVIPSAAKRPRQLLACALLELLADEWMLTPGYHYRWRYTWDRSDGRPTHYGHNTTQWGVGFNQAKREHQH